MKSSIFENTIFCARFITLCVVCFLFSKILTTGASQSSRIDSENKLVKNLTDDVPEDCYKRRLAILVSHPDCKGPPARTHVNYCTGSCLSYSVIGEVEPFVRTEFRCCAAEHIGMKKRKLLFSKCEGEDKRLNPEGFKNITLFFPFFNKCECVIPVSVLNSSK